MVQVFRWVAVKILAPGVALIIIVLAVVLFTIGFKDLQIGGLLAKLLGVKSGGKAIDVTNSLPPTRVDPDGKLIPEGQADAKGQTQAVVVPIQDPGLFSNPDTVKFIPPNSSSPVEVTLPTGVKANDVEKVIVVQPNVYVVSVRDSSGIPTQAVDDLLKKYGG